MTLEDWLANHWISKHETSAAEISALRAVVDRDLRDAGIESLSADRRFATAYNAALQLSKMALAVAGYRLSKGHGGHERAFDVVRYVVPAEEIEDLCEFRQAYLTDEQYIHGAVDPLFALRHGSIDERSLDPVS